MNMFKIGTIQYVYLLPLFLLGVFFIYKIYSKNKKFNSVVLSKMRNYKYSNVVFRFKILFLSLSFLLMFIAVLRPAWGENQGTFKSRGSDVIFTLDVSKSMKALDVGNGTEDRLTLAKSMIRNFVHLHPENRYGLVIFAGESFVSSPLTSDLDAFLTFLNGVDYNDVGTQGTNIDEALKSSINRFYSKQDKKRGRAIVVISDGGDEMSSNISSFAKIVKKLHISVFTIGIGSDKKVPIPEGTDVFGRIRYKKYKGRTVFTKLNEKVLKQIAKETGGEYFHAQKKGDLKRIVKKLKTLKTTVIETKENAGKQDHYQDFLLPSLIFFILFIILEFFNDMEIFYKMITRYKKYFQLSIFILLTLSLSGCSNSNFVFKYHNNKGNELYNKEYFGEAKREYKKAGEFSHQLKYISDNNYALSLYQENKYQESLNKLEKTIAIYCGKNKSKYCDELFYNLGNAYYRQGEGEATSSQLILWQKAIKAYEGDLKINPKDKEAQENIDFIKNKLKQKKQLQNAKNNKNNSKNNKQDSNKNSQKKGTGNSNDSVKNNNSDNKNKGDSDKNSQTANSKKGDNKTGKSNQSSATGDNEKKNNSGQHSSSNNQSNSNKLDKRTSQQVDNYMKSLDQQAKNNQSYFRRNPKGSYKSGNPLDDFFNDPFFDDFFNMNPFNKSFNKEHDNTNGVDW